MQMMRNQPQINIKKIFAEREPAMIKRVEASAARGESGRDLEETSGITVYADQVLETIQVCAFELLKSVPEAALWNKQWSQALDLCHEFVDTQGEWLFQKCLQLWGGEAQVVQSHIDEVCAGIKAALGSEIEIAHRLKRSSPWEPKARESIKISPAETIKILVISIVALALGYFLGKLL